MNYRTERLPVVTFTLLGLNTLVYLLSLYFAMTTQGRSDAWIREHLWLIPATSSWYAWLTSMFVHAGFWHLFGNLIYLFLFGCCAEDLIGRWRFLIFYLVGGLLAELVFIATLPGYFASTEALCGASGAISACLGMYLCLRANADITFKYVYLFLGTADYGEWEIPAWMAIGFWFLEDLFRMLIDLLYPRLAGDGVAFGAHVGGMLAGMALVLLFRINKTPRPEATPAAEILSPAEIAAAAAAARPAPTALEIPTIYLHSDGSQTGPFTLAELQYRLDQNEIPAGTLYWSAGMNQWENIQELAGRPLV